MFRFHANLTYCRTDKEISWIFSPPVFFLTSLDPFIPSLLLLLYSGSGQDCFCDQSQAAFLIVEKCGSCAVERHCVGEQTAHRCCRCFECPELYLCVVSCGGSTDLVWVSDGELFGDTAGLLESTPLFMSAGFSEWGRAESAWTFEACEACQ